MKRGLPSPAFIYKCSGERWKISYWQEVVVAQKWTTLDGNQSFEFAVLGQHFFVEWSFQFEFANKLSTNVSHYLISFRAWSLQCFIASRKSHHSVYILVFLLNPLPLLDAKVARSPRPSKRHPLFSIIKIFERFQALENWQQDFLICLTELRR